MSELNRQETFEEVKRLCFQIVDTLTAYQPKDDYFIMTFGTLPRENNRQYISFWNSSFRHDLTNDELNIMPIEGMFDYPGERTEL